MFAAIPSVICVGVAKSRDAAQEPTQEGQQSRASQSEMTATCSAHAFVVRSSLAHAHTLAQTLADPEAMAGVEFVALGNFSAPPEGVDPADVDLGVYSIGKPVAYPGAAPVGFHP